MIKQLEFQINIWDSLVLLSVKPAWGKAYYAYFRSFLYSLLRTITVFSHNYKVYVLLNSEIIDSLFSVK